MEYEITSGLGIIDIISDGFINYLKIKRPVAADWPDCFGSVGRYYVVSDHNAEQRGQIVKEINAAMATGSEDLIFNIMPSFLKLFANGTYYVNILKDIKEYELDDSGYYPNYEYHFTFTQPRSSINAGRVNYYKEIISKGGRPKAVVFSKEYTEEGTHDDGSQWICTENSAYYILDGHHKLIAYKELKIPPEIVMIESKLSGKAELFKHRPTIFFEVEPLLHKADPLKLHLIGHIPQILTGNDPQTVQYNETLDRMLGESRGLGIAMLHLFLEAFNKKDEDHLSWLLHRLQPAMQKAMKGEAAWLNFWSKEKKYWDGMQVNNINDFDAWCVKMFGKTYAELHGKA